MGLQLTDYLDNLQTFDDTSYEFQQLQMSNLLPVPNETNVQKPNQNTKKQNESFAYNI